jgi:hypothetical protein
MFSIETSSGKLISGYSYFQHEDEILLPPGRYLKVIDKSSPAKDLHIIHLREIQPPYPMLAEPFDLKATSVVSKPSVQVSSQKGKYASNPTKYNKFVTKHICSRF